MARQRICLRCGQLRKLQQLQLDFAAEAALQLQQRAGVCNAQQADLPQHAEDGAASAAVLPQLTQLLLSNVYYAEALPCLSSLIKLRELRVTLSSSENTASLLSGMPQLTHLQLEVARCSSRQLEQLLEALPVMQQLCWLQQLEVAGVTQEGLSAAGLQPLSGLSGLNMVLLDGRPCQMLSAAASCVQPGQQEVQCTSTGACAVEGPVGSCM
ncbi:hypothetical protein COO60DRAFT_1702665 [Scenedesmus sp. NREL 46B-D3]|nr:hypothetical protein COO60DRAFT_1702665 [Scenedesmus sp. NREL 46B-D3]